MIKTTEDSYEARCIILATGNKKDKPVIQNLEAFEGRGISYCAVCDGFFYKNKEIAVIGSGNYAIAEVNELINLASKVTILTNGEKAPEVRTDSGNIKIDTRKIEAIEGDKKVEKVKFEEGKTIPLDGIFIATRCCSEA